ncbi:hypothetical protein C8R44DRAFT_880172 [Mycena epipterygia]|nr:hypothetical protein C8R44DRAFT_880172 [Mycena epipterygia]
MPDKRSTFIVSSTSPQKTLRSRHYSTFQPQARFVALKVTLSSLTPTFTTSTVKLDHGHKTSYFRVFLKHGKRIAANQHALANGLVGEIVIMRLSASNGTTLINSCTTDGPVMDFVLLRAQARIRGF